MNGSVLNSSLDGEEVVRDLRHGDARDGWLGSWASRRGRGRTAAETVVSGEERGLGRCGSLVDRRHTARLGDRKGACRTAGACRMGGGREKLPRRAERSRHQHLVKIF